MKPQHSYLHLLKAFLLLLLCSSIGHAQTKTIEQEQTNLQKKSSSIESSLKKGESDISIAAKYESLARELVKNNELAKAEEYQQKAVDIYKRNKSKQKLSYALRELAKIQEAQNKTNSAIQSYDKASQNATDKNSNSLNQADAERLKFNDAPDQKTNSINKKIKLLKSNSSNQGKTEEIADAYKQMAEVNLSQNQSGQAIENYNNAISNLDNNPVAINNLKSEIADIYANNNKINEAITLKNAIIQNADSINDITQQIKQRQDLANLLLLNKEDDKALQLVQEAYNLALIKGKTFEAKNSLNQLIDFYKKKHDDKKTLELYENFLQKLETLIKSDSSLIDKKLFEESDNKIKLLEKERNLQNELIQKKNTFNYALIAGLIVLIILIAIIIRYSMAVRRNNKTISLQSLRREMNPHFIFNSLNSVNQFIAQNKEIEANKYLSSYSSLMRNMMENSSRDFIPLQKEIEQLQKYLELEHLRFHDKFDFSIHIDENLDTDSYQIPNMLIQPHLENAIWHGLRYKPEKGLLKLYFNGKNDHLEIVIDDDGIGIEKSKAIKTENQKLHQSIGIKNINERISLLNDLYQLKITCRFESKPNDGGTIVTLAFPYLNK